ncbi:DUF2806 domain-containing protein [Occallatibacter savannae]|uniref:DUF2806 domain-containing protein n=1 Tax=Occallatibacter savannae TaxID=1002691 RepID=UPI000D6930F5|nr:DUF2806 domain-containing protein [Occallatibacter savannae]
MSSNSLINLGDLSKPATALIEKVSDAVGGICKPWQIVRVAKADAEAERIRAESRIQVSDIQQRALLRFLTEEGKKQGNIEEITAKALPLLKDEAEPREIDDDWITNFFDKSRIVSDSDMQQIWGAILASEANSPRSFSRKTVNLIADLEKPDAELFTALCGFVWTIGEAIPLVLRLPVQVYENYGIDFRALSHLETLGLIRFDHSVGFSRIGVSQRLRVAYFGTEVGLTLQNDRDNQFPCGTTLFTKAGTELSRVCAAKRIDEFFNYVLEEWTKKGFSPTLLSSPNAD